MLGGLPPFDESVQPSGEASDAGDDADDSIYDDSIYIDLTDGFSVEAGSLEMERRLSRGQKLRRAGLAVLVVAVAAFCLLGGPSASVSWLGSLRPPVHQSTPAEDIPPRLGSMLTNLLPLPVGVHNNLTLRLAPSNGPDDYVYSCWSDLDTVNQGLSYQLHVGIYTRASDSWSGLPVPMDGASVCAVIADREREGGVLLAAWPAISDSTSCLLPRLFYSADAGRLWKAIPWPNDVETSCDPQFFLEAGRIYIQSPTPLLPAAALAASSASGFLLTTDTGTVAWRPADSGQVNVTSFKLIALRPHGRLLAESLQGGPNSYQVGLLWESDDCGEHWQLSAPLPGDSPVVSASSDPAAIDHGGWGYIYVDYFTGGVAIRPALSYGVLDTAGGSWISLPLPAVGSTLQGGPMAGYLPDGAEGPLESLIYLLPAGSSAQKLSPLYQPWLWDTAKKAWRMNGEPLPANSIPDGVSWQDGVMSILVSVIYPSLVPALLTYSLILSPRQLKTAQSEPARPAGLTLGVGKTLSARAV